MKKTATTAQKMKRTGLILILSMMYPVTAYGSTAQDIAVSSSGLVTGDHGALVSGITNEAEFVPAFEHAVTNALRVCGAAEIVHYPFRYEEGGVIYRIPADQVDFLLARQAYVQEWLARTVPSVIPAGTDAKSAIRTVFDYIIANYSYDYDAPEDFYSIHDSQGAYRIITTGRGICSGYSKLFRGMVEYLPFNEQGVVDYEAEEGGHLSVAIVNWTKGHEGHEWNAIKDPKDGQWYHYDLSETVTDPGGVKRFRLSDVNIVGDGKHGRVAEHTYEY